MCPGGLLIQTPGELTVFQSAVIKTRDPDVIVGHEFLGVYLDVILMRLKQLKVEPWSCIGRFRRSKWPQIGRQGSNIRFLQGRLLCDLASDAAKVCLTDTFGSLEPDV